MNNADWHQSVESPVRGDAHAGFGGRVGETRCSSEQWRVPARPNSSIQSTTALSGGFKYKPTTSRILASSSGSVENLKVCTRHGCSPHFFHVVLTV